MEILYFTIIILVLILSIIAKEHLNIDILRTKLEANEIPIKDFDQYLTSPIDTQPSGLYNNLDEEDSYFLLYNNYINQLRDYYFEKVKHIKNLKDSKSQQQVENIIIQCRQDMEAAIPTKYIETWKYQVIYSFASITLTVLLQG